MSVSSLLGIGSGLVSPTVYGNDAKPTLTVNPASESAAIDDALGLGVTTPDAASVLRSAARLGLDVTSPEAASILRSAAAIGLDVSSAQRASALTSTAEMSTAITTSYSASKLNFAGSDSQGQL